MRYKHTNQCFLFVEMREDTYETYMSINEQTKEERKNHPVPPDTFDTFIWEALVHHFNDNDAKKRRLEISRVQCSPFRVRLLHIAVSQLIKLLILHEQRTVNFAC